MSKDKTIKDLKKRNEQLEEIIYKLRDYMLDIDYKMGEQYVEYLDKLLLDKLQKIIDTDITSKNLFEELGFKLDEDYDFVVWRNNSFPSCDIYFFDKNNIEIDTEYGVSVNLLKAINKQIEELGWLDEDI